MTTRSTRSNGHSSQFGDGRGVWAIHLLVVAVLVVLSADGCSREQRLAAPTNATLTIGFGSTTGTRVQQVADLITAEGLVNLGPDGRPVPWLAQSWSVAPDGLTWRFVLKEGVTFHDGTPLNANLICEILRKQLPTVLGSAAKDIKSIAAASTSEFVITLHQRSTFVPEALTNLIHPPDSNAGTGPFAAVEMRDNALELRANDKYVGGKPMIDRVIIQPYGSVRSAWADLLRGRVDMIYEVGVDALDLISSATATRVFTFRRPYAYAVLLNTRKPSLEKPRVRRLLNEMINRDQFVAVALDGHGRPTTGPMWPDHWTNDGSLSQFAYAPSDLSAEHLSFTCLYSDPTLERMALVVQQQLRAAGVEIRLELVSVNDALARVAQGDFDAWLADAGIGPGLLRQSLFWHSGSPYNWGRYSNAQVDAALDAVRAAENDRQYKQAVVAFQEAMVEDPPAIFLAWSERARAVSSRFDVHQEPGRDILTTMRLWKPLSVAQLAAPN